LETKFAVGDEIFFPPHIILGVGKQRDFGNKICQTVGDALKEEIAILNFFLLQKSPVVAS
jgi:hypothetical protein